MWLDHLPTALYRLYDESGTLLYIGISYQPEVRFEQHAALKPWWDRVARREMVWFPDRPTAAKAEAEAVRTEDPEYNGTYSPRIDRRTMRDVIADDGIREISLTLARAKLPSIIREVEATGRPVALLNHGQRYAVILPTDFYDFALQVMAARELLEELEAGTSPDQQMKARILRESLDIAKRRALDSS